MDSKPILILGGGINGAAVARELALNGQSVWLIDTADLSFGATAYSSRLIHGGLRYLEFADFGLVKESLAERARLLRLAPHLVRPLRLFIPVRNRFGGFGQAAAKFLGLPVRAKKPAARGLNVVRLGLWLYDRYSRGGEPRGGELPRRSLHRPGEPNTPRVTASWVRWLWAYSDAQIPLPERLVIGFLADARQIARERGTDFRVFTYTRATLAQDGKTVELRPASESAADPIAAVQPAAIINATGAWVDHTLAKLPVPSRRLMGGTKGSHFLTFQPRLKELLGGQAIYAEARDGRPVFMLPLLEGTLVGTTDIPFEGDPDAAVATEAELEYLISAVNDVLPDAGLTRGDLAMHQCGVRPLPYVDANAKTPAAITRRHQLVWNEECRVPLVSLVGGKLTTCRSLAEETAAAVLSRLDHTAEHCNSRQSSRERPIPPTAIDSQLMQPAFDLQLAARHCIDHEWAEQLEDIALRRLMLHFRPGLNRQSLADLATVLVEKGKLQPAEVAAAINNCATRLKNHFGIVLGES